MREERWDRCGQRKRRVTKADKREAGKGVDIGGRVDGQGVEGIKGGGTMRWGWKEVEII